jgi:hypothetical protein
MPNPIGNFGNNATRMPFGKPGQPVQCVSDTKYSTKTLAIGVAPAQTDFFTSAPSADRTVDNYDAGNQLVTSGKAFVIQGITANVISTSIADVDAVIQKGVVVLTAQGKEIGAFRLRNLSAGGGTFVAGAQVAAASSVGVVNGMPQSDLFRVAELMIATNQSFKASLLMPTVAPYTIIAATAVEIGLQGYEIRPVA